jgi:hypothetical protein
MKVASFEPGLSRAESGLSPHNDLGMRANLRTAAASSG